jgi:hypothetical protein
VNILVKCTILQETDKTAGHPEHLQETFNQNRKFFSLSGTNPQQKTSLSYRYAKSYIYITIQQFRFSQEIGSFIKNSAEFRNQPPNFH